MATRNITEAFITELGRKSVRPAILFEGSFGGQVFRFWTGTGPLTWNGNTFLGNGIFAGVTTVRESSDLSASAFAVLLNGVDPTIKSLVLNSTQHSDYGKVWFAFLRDTNEENLLPYSNTFTEWAASAATVTANVTANPITRTSTAYLLKNALTNASHYIKLNDRPVAAGTQYLYTVYAQRRELSRLRLVMEEALTADVTFNLNDGTYNLISGSNAEIKHIFNGWYRCRVWAVSSGAGNVDVSLNLVNDAGASIYLGAGVDGVHIYNAQLQRVGTTDKPVSTEAAIVTATTPGRAVIADPYLRAEGLLDVPTLTESATESSVAISYESKAARLQDRAIIRYTQEGQKALYGADKGFEHVAKLQLWQGNIS